MIKIFIILLFLSMVIIFAGKYFVSKQKPSVTPVSTSSPIITLDKNQSKGQILKAKIVRYDSTTLTVKLESGEEMIFTDLARLTIWEIVNKGPQERPQRSDWSKIRKGQNVSLSMDKSGQKLISIIIL